MRLPLLAALFAAIGLATAAAPPPAPKKEIPNAKKGESTEAKEPAPGENLVPNGDFEEGDISPKGWQSVDNLCAYWVKDSDPKHGKVMKFDTDVYQREAYDWWVKLAKGASPLNAPKKTQPVGDKYDTIAGLDGAWFWSDYIPVKKGRAYWFTLDVKGPGIMTWLVGYKEKGGTAFGSEAKAFQEVLQEAKTGKPPDRGRNFESIIAKYVWRGQMQAGGSGEWKTYSRRNMPFRPTISAGRPNGVKYIRVLLYPFWPPGDYYVDNVKVVELPDDDPRVKGK
jgi:hypothetical protein